jgi:hypothetical protein
LLLAVGVVDLAQTMALELAGLVDCSPTSEAQLIQLLLLRYIPLQLVAAAREGW